MHSHDLLLTQGGPRQNLGVRRKASLGGEKDGPRQSIGVWRRDPEDIIKINGFISCVNGKKKVILQNQCANDD